VETNVLQSKSFYIVNPKATCHITRQASINAIAYYNHILFGKVNQLL